MKRKIYNKLKTWKERSNGKSAALIDGARRIGKSYIAKEFAQNEYKSFILIDFSYPNPDVIKCFEEDYYDLNTFFQKLEYIFNTHLYKRESLIIFDEVQAYPKARQLIKHLVADGRYDYLETGSLISLHQNVKDILIPSEEQHFKMYPMDFEEFLLALNHDLAIPFLKECFENKKPLGSAVHMKMLREFRKYLLVGGMPQAVLEYSQSENFENVDMIKKQILSLYNEDIGKYSGKYKQKVSLILKNIPNELAKKEKKFKLSNLGENARYRDYIDAFSWLEESMIVNLCLNSTEPTIGFRLSANITSQKCYMGDTGLLITHAFKDNEYLDNTLYKSILLDKLNINEGMLMENIVAQMLKANGHELFFYSRYDKVSKENNMEIDFLISKNGKVSPIEVKSSSYNKHSSLDKFCKKFSKNIGEKYILYTKDVMIKDGITHLPIYMCMFL
ncbi:MAG: AAA family ATPase [Bdellovibrionota bacterium]|nr:AAA family ATPase [Bdellovibrionota bacterium]